MFAVIEDGSRQYRVQEGDTLVVDYRVSLTKGDSFTFSRVLLANAGGASSIGHPAIEGAIVEAEVVDSPIKGPKIEVQKIRRRKNSRTHTGHRQKYTSVVIRSIDIPGLEIVEQLPESTIATPDQEPPSPTSEIVDSDESAESTEVKPESAETETESEESSGAAEEEKS